MKVAIVGPSHPFRGGIAHYTTCLYRAFADYCKNVDTSSVCRYFAFSRQYPQFLFPGKSDREPDGSPFEEKGAELIMDGCNPFSWLSTAWTIRSFEPDICILQWWVSFWTPQFLTILALLPEHCRVVTICHNSSEHEGSVIGGVCRRLVLSRSDTVVCHSQEECDTIAREFNTMDVRKCFHSVIPEAVYSFSDSQKEDVKRELGAQGPLLVYFGFVRPYKGVDILLQAMPEVLRKHPECTLMVIGEGWADTTSELNQIIDELGLHGSVIMMNQYVDEKSLSLHLQVADLAIFPYRTVTGSLALMTAFGHNLPVVASNIGCFQEIVSSGEVGMLCAPQDSADLAEKIVQSLEEGVLKRFRSGISKVKERYSWDTMVKTILRKGETT